MKLFERKEKKMPKASSRTNDLHMLGSLAALVVNRLAFLHVRLSSCLWSRGRGSDNGTTRLCGFVNKKSMIKIDFSTSESLVG